MRIVYGVIAAAIWIYINWYLLKNRKAVAKLVRGYGAYEAWKMREWVEGAEDVFELGERERAHGLREGAGHVSG